MGFCRSDANSNWKASAWTRRGAAVAVSFLLLASARDASANCAGGGNVQTVSAGQNLASIITGSTVPCTLTVNQGTYVAPGNEPFMIFTGITIRANGAVTLQVSAAAFAAVAIWPEPFSGSCPSGATLEGFTLRSTKWGVFVGALPPSRAGCASNQVSGITLRGLNIVTDGAPVDGHGIDFHAVQNSVIDSCIVNNAYANGIFLEDGSNNNIVMNSVVASTMTQHGIAVQGSSDNVIVGNSISGAAFDGILLNMGASGLGSSRNRIERNAISGHMVDGITLTDASGFNYVGLNMAVSSSYHPVTKPNPNPASGTGIWVNNASNGNYLFGNDVSGSPENGIDVLTSTSTYIQANRVHGNLHGGIWIANVQFAASASSPVPRDTVLQGNNIFFNTFNAQVNLEGAINTEVSYNYLSGAQSGTLAGNGTGGMRLREGGDSTRGIVASSSVSFFENTVTDVSNRGFVFGTTTNALFFRNRFLNGSNNPYAPGGRHGITYSLTPASVQWDANGILGGNHWSEFSVASGNPDAGHPYNGFIGNTNGGPYVDRFPYQSEGLTTHYAPYSVKTVEPVAGSVLAAGTTKTVRWVARGCVLVDIYYGSGAGMSLIASRYPNVGHYFWTVPAVPFRSDYFVQVVCLNSSGGGVGVAGNSPLFSIAASGLALLNPGRGFRAVDGGTVRVAWAKSSEVASVYVFVKSGAGPETQIGPVAGTILDVVLPGSVSSSSRVTVRIQDAGNSSRQDSVDGYFMVRGTPSFTTALAGQTLLVGSVQLLDWVGMPSSYTVDLDLYQNNVPIRSIVKNLPDFGNYTWFVPEMVSMNSKIRATFRNASGAVTGQVDTAVFKILYKKLPTGDFDGDGKSDLVIYRPSDGGWYIRHSSLGYSTTNWAYYQWGVSTDQPLTADFDGDGRTDVAVYRPSDGGWYIRFSSLGYNATSWFYYQWGGPGDTPIAEDFDGDGKADLAIYRPSDGGWYIRFSSLGYSDAGAAYYQWGLSTDKPLGSDFDGDGKADLAIYRPSDGGWYIRYSSLGYSTTNWAYYQWGVSTDQPLAADFDGDGRTDLAIYRPSDGGWYIRFSSLGYSAANWSYYQWGLSTDKPVALDFDGDGKADLAIYRPSDGGWYIRYSSLGYSTTNWAYYQWGLGTDVLLKP